ncbi:MAG TPA: HDIG domain-containing protein, partial [Abditibacteriaceae bacterium]
MTNPPSEPSAPLTETGLEPQVQALPVEAPLEAPPGAIEDASSSTLQAIGQLPLLPPREPLGARVAGVFGRHQAALVALCILLLWAIVALPPLWRREPYQVGMAAGHDILAPQQTFLLDAEETRRRQDDAANLVTPDYDPNPNAQAAALADLGSLVRAARELSAPSSAPSPGRLALPRWRARYQALAVKREHLSDAALQTMARLPLARWNAIEATTHQAIRVVYQKGQLRSDVLSSGSADLAQGQTLIREVTSKALEKGALTQSEAGIVAALAVAAIAKHPNQVINERQTELLREVARAGVPPVYVKFKADDVLVSANEIITERHWAQMQEMGLVAPSLAPEVMLARLGLVVLLVFFGAAYLKTCHPRLIAQPAALWLAAMVPVAFAFAFRLLLRVPHAEYLMVPLAATAAMLLTVLTNARVGVVVGFMLSALCSIMARTDATWLLAGSLASSIGALCVSNLSSLMHVVRAGSILALTNAVLFCAIGILSEMTGPEIGRIVLWEAIAGVGAVAFMSGLALLLERPFGITTHFRLMELLSPGEVVMRRMQAEAPGTYTHSLMVALLAEAGAKAVGADPLLCHVGGLYHDIGKLRRPHCFIENQSGHNIHDELSPQLSALIILAHVKDGLELGRALRLPQPVLDIIAQHHGTTVLSYFYNRALQGAGSATIPAADVSSEAPQQLTAFNSQLPTPDVTLFRYAGPRPQSKEAALILLADSIEASSRSLPEVTPETLRVHIQKMIALRLQEGELSECELT